MKRFALYAVLAVAGFLVWQWWISRRNTVLFDAEKKRKDADRAGQAQENLALSARPRLADPEGFKGLAALLTGANTLWSQIFSDGTVNNSPEKVYLEPAANPFLFGYGRN